MLPARQLTPASPAQPLLTLAAIRSGHSSARKPRFPTHGEGAEVTHPSVTALRQVATKTQGRILPTTSLSKPQPLQTPTSLCCPCLHPHALSNTKYSAILLTAIESSAAEDALVSPTSNGRGESKACPSAPFSPALLPTSTAQNPLSEHGQKTVTLLEKSAL